jgi:betaine reductase
VSTLARELERLGLPCVTITALPSIARLSGAARVLRGRAVTHPVGDPAMSAQAERELRRAMLERALEMLGSEMNAPTVWDMNG